MTTSNLGASFEYTCHRVKMEHGLVVLNAACEDLSRKIAHRLLQILLLKGVRSKVFQKSRLS